MEVGDGVSRGVGGAGKPARLILAARAAGQGVGLPAGWAVPGGSRISRRVRGGGKCPGGSMILPYRGRENLLINGGLCGVEMHQRGRQRKGYGDARCAPARQGWAGAAPARVKVMEMHQGRRPVYGGAPRTGADIQTQTKSHGGSRGPADPWSAAAASKRRGEALERLCREIAQRCADGRSASEPVPLFPAAVQAANAKGLGPCLTSIQSRKNDDNSRSCRKEGRKVIPASKLHGHAR